MIRMKGQEIIRQTALFALVDKCHNIKGLNNYISMKYISNKKRTKPTKKALILD